MFHLIFSPAQKPPNLAGSEQPCWAKTMKIARDHSAQRVAVIAPNQANDVAGGWEP
jgi:hypothetical protein